MKAAVRCVTTAARGHCREHRTLYHRYRLYEMGWRPSVAEDVVPRPERVAIIGAGPAGLQLVRMC